MANNHYQQSDLFSWSSNTSGLSETKHFCLWNLSLINCKEESNESSIMVVSGTLWLRLRGEGMCKGRVTPKFANVADSH